jgi:hypothetical protein
MAARGIGRGRLHQRLPAALVRVSHASQRGCWQLHGAVSGRHYLVTCPVRCRLQAHTARCRPAAAHPDAAAPPAEDVSRNRPSGYTVKVTVMGRNGRMATDSIPIRWDPSASRNGPAHSLSPTGNGPGAHRSDAVTAVVSRCRRCAPYMYDPPALRHRIGVLLLVISQHVSCLTGRRDPPWLVDLLCAWGGLRWGHRLGR